MRRKENRRRRSASGTTIAAFIKSTPEARLPQPDIVAMEVEPDDRRECKRQQGECNTPYERRDGRCRSCLLGRSLRWISAALICGDASRAKAM